MSNSFLNCLVMAFFGSVRILTSAASSSSSSVATTGRRPTNSGIRPNLIRSSGSTSASSLPISALRSLLLTLAPKPMPPASVLRCWMILSRPANAPPHDEQDVAGVDLQELLLRVLAPALRRHAGDGALDQLEQRLLHALARHVAGDRRVLGLARDLVDLVDVDDALLRLLDVVVALLQQLLDDVLDVLADVAGLGERGGVGDGERHVEHPRQRLGQQRLARAGRADQQDVGLGQLDLVVLLPALDALVVVVDRDREGLLRALLADHVLVEDRRGSRAAWAGCCGRTAPSPRAPRG
jgi:hypothetical protein